MKANQRAIFILQRSSAFAAIAALFCLAVFLQDPSEPKNALFLGYSAPRLAVAVLIGCAALFIIALSSSLWIQEGRPGSLGAWAVSQLSKLLAHRRNLRTLSIGTLFGIFLVLSVLLWRQGSPPFYHMYLERLEPLISWFLIFFVLLFTVVWLLASDKKMNASEVSTLFQDALCASSLYFIFVYLVAVSGRIHYPFELEWVEGGMLSVVERVRMGLPAYQAPTLDYAPFIYPPLYFQFADSLSPLVGSSFLSLRLLSFLASVCAAGLLYLIAYRETGQRSLGLLSVGLYAAGYAASGAWYDLARVDSLMLLLVLAAYYVLRFQPQRHRELLASLFIVLACFTKQQAFFIHPRSGFGRMAHASQRAAILGGYSIAPDRFLPLLRSADGRMAEFLHMANSGASRFAARQAQRLLAAGRACDFAQRTRPADLLCSLLTKTARPWTIFHHLFLAGCRRQRLEQQSKQRQLSQPSHPADGRAGRGYPDQLALVGQHHLSARPQSGFGRAAAGSGPICQFSLQLAASHPHAARPSSRSGTTRSHRRVRGRDLYSSASLSGRVGRQNRNRPFGRLWRGAGLLRRPSPARGGSSLAGDRSGHPNPTVQSNLAGYPRLDVKDLPRHFGVLSSQRNEFLF